MARWILLVFAADEHSANYRVYAQAVQAAADLRPHVLVYFSPCILHILHRSVIPSLKYGNYINELYRAAHVMRVSSYWLTLVETAMMVIEKTLVVVHNSPPPDRVQRLVTEQILRLGLRGARCKVDSAIHGGIVWRRDF